MEEEGIGGPPELSLIQRERNRLPIGTRRQLWVSSLAADDRVNAAPSPLPRRSRSGRNSERVTNGEKRERERVATAVLFRSGEDERVKRATLVKLALRLLPIYRSTTIWWSDFIFLSTTVISICVCDIKEKKLSV
jgi:hypothetical protein